MFTLVSSDATELFRRHAMDILCYPSEHVTQFRYDESYVDTEILKHCNSEGEARVWLDYVVDSVETLIVYAECPKEASGHFIYRPLRYGYVQHIRKVGSIVYVDVLLNGYPDLSRWKTSSEGSEFATWMDSRAGSIRPKDVATTGGTSGASLVDSGDGGISADTRKVKGEGKFFYMISRKDLRGADSRSNDQRWESVVDQIAPLDSMEGVLFYRVIGFFKSAERIFGYGQDIDRSEQCKSKTRFGQSVFFVPMGRPVDLKLSFYRPRNARPQIINAEFTVFASEDAYSKIPDNRIQLQSRYDEVSVHLVTKRVFDNVLAPVSIRLAGNQPRNCAAEPLLLTVVPVPRWIKIFVFPALLVVPLLLSTGAEDIKGFLEVFLAYDCGSKPAARACADAAALSWLAKGIGAFVGAFIGIVVFRRLPAKGL